MASPVATQFPGHGCMDDLKTERTCTFDLQATRVIDVLGLLFDTSSMEVCTNRRLADVRSNGAGIKCLYCICCRDRLIDLVFI